MLQQGTRQNVERYKQKRKQQTRFFREEKGRLEKVECEEMELLCRSQETRKFYQKLNASRNGFVPRAEICRDKDGSLLTVGLEMIERWRQHFDEHLNGVENVGMGDQGNGDNDYVSAAEEGNDHTPTLRDCRDYQVPTYHLFIDFKAAYDSIDRTELWKIMDENGFPGKLTRLIKATLDAKLRKGFG